VFEKEVARTNCTSMPPVATLDLTLVEGTWSGTVLSWISVLDDWGAATWNLRHVAIATALTLGLIRKAMHKNHGVDWYAFVHALVTGWGSLLAVYISVAAAETLTGTTEPLRSVLCQGPLTSLHRILPAITMGYALFDVVDGFTTGLDFVSFTQHTQ
jgi:hypothetical protein